MASASKAPPSDSKSPGSPCWESVCPSLPPELWIRILSHHTDLLHLWTTCRLVSPTFLAYVEQAFAETHLRTARIDFQLEKHNLGGRTRRPEIPCTFDRFGGSDGNQDGNGRDVVWFTDHRSREEEDVYDEVMERWADRVRTSKPETPHYIISLGSIVNDTALPGLKFDANGRGVSFRWREMLTLFFREQAWFLQLRKGWQAGIKKRVVEDRQRQLSGDMVKPGWMPSWETSKLELRKDIRRRRLREAYQENEEMQWAVGSLKYFERCSAYAQGSKAFNLVTNIRIPGASVGEKWFGSVNLLQGLYLDEWSCLHRIDVKEEHLGLQ
ncbi:hypothetical protein BCR34DRAFT_488262 [Clohesyomyces aquaticus]|uniref:F-box domain-containing protein n=1 Tax=Clohesyomyces aquaticus TaxID=1231657 RepID=A0A1Y1ZF30_9PLEO|nr:hypothetical protein BCR34DRAFT_488262 [Clohesyomyces aquaticus]